MTEVRTRARATDWVIFIVPAEMHPDRAGYKCPALVVHDAEETGPDEADLIVFLHGVGPQSLTAVRHDEEHEDHGTWHYPTTPLRAKVATLVEEFADLDETAVTRISQLEEDVARMGVQLHDARADLTKLVEEVRAELAKLREAARPPAGG